jgi:1-acyl-sn-glycerol-3-phosphate acyltransferase
MGDRFYSTFLFFSRHVFWLSSRPIVIGVEHTRHGGAFIVAATHQSPYDVPLMIRHAGRRLDFISTTEAFAHPMVRWFYQSFNAFPLDRSKRDAAAVRTVFSRLRRGRVVAMFPEGRLRTGADSVVHTRHIRRGVARIARTAGAPIVPCVILNAAAYARLSNWLPIRRVRYGIAFGSPIEPRGSREEIETRLIDAFVELHGQLQQRLQEDT